MLGAGIAASYVGGGVVAALSSQEAGSATVWILLAALSAPLAALLLYLAVRLKHLLMKAPVTVTRAFTVIMVLNVISLNIAGVLLAAYIRRNVIRLSAYARAIAAGLSPDEAEEEAAASVRSADAWSRMARGKASENRHEEALRLFDRAIRRDSTSADTWRERGNSLVELKRFRDAISSYDSSLALDCGDFHSWYGRGFAADELGDSGLAIESYAKAVGLRGESSDELVRYARSRVGNSS